MAVTTVQSNNKLIKFTEQINREFIRENMFDPYTSDDINAIIRRRFELKSGGEQMNIPLVTKLRGNGVSTGVLAGNEERIDNYGMRIWIDFLRHAVATTNAEQQKDSADIFGEAKPLLSDFAKERLRDEMIQGFMALPSTAAPANLGSSAGQRVNGIMFGDSTAAQKNTWLADNVDRVLFGNALSNHFSSTTIATFTSALSMVGTAQKFTVTTLQMLKRRAELCSPKIRPYKTRDGYEYYVVFAGTYAFRDLKASLETVNRDARAREGDGMKNNPLFQDGDQIFDGVIVRKVPEISNAVSSGTLDGGFTGWSAFVSGGVSGRIEPVFLCGQQAATHAIGRAIKPTFRKEDDYGFVSGTGIETAYGVAKNFKSHAMYIPGTTTLNSASTAALGGGESSLVQWGVVTGFFSAQTDS
jgi:hypothetical protein